MSIQILDVGGVIYKTTKHTLKGSTYLTNLIAGNEWTNHTTSKDQHVFIDRDGKLFHYVLEYMRTKSIHAPDPILSSLKEEAKFYHLTEMEEKIEQMLNHKQVSVSTEEGILSLREISRLSNIEIEYSLCDVVKPLPVNKNGYNILTTLRCLKKVYKCPRNISTHTEPFRCGKSCELNVSEESRWVKEEERMYLVSRNNMYTDGNGV
ncbi:BTB/POZ protein [Pilaira anomala]|nr:BTB/POZ protein [Pilaira anomala]